VKRCASQAEIANLVPHDLRRTCTRLCHSCGGELEQIQFLLGHASVQTRERYIGSKQKFQDAVTDRPWNFNRKRHRLKNLAAAIARGVGDSVLYHSRGLASRKRLGTMPGMRAIRACESLNFFP
jgi:hypothetical protein